MINSDFFKNKTNNTLFDFLSIDSKKFIENLLKKYLFSYQQMKIICEITKDLEDWNKFSDFKELLENFENNIGNNLYKNPSGINKLIFSYFCDYYENLKISLKEYDNKKTKEANIENISLIPKTFETNILGNCPVYSDKTLCCGLKTLDVVQNCPFNCSYCTIQTFYGNDFIYVKNLKEKLKEIKFDNNLFYHIGTGQSSDALIWGNAFSILDDLMEFARNHKNILLELKTKSSNVSYFLENKNIPSNIVCSWTINTPKVIQNEEKGSASLEDRINAAKKIAKKGIKIAFHFHPIIYYKGWEEDYKETIKLIKDNFTPNEISFISFGSLTFIKPVIKEIREKKKDTKILWMPTSLDPNKKITYPKELKIKLYQTLYNYFKDWKDNVFFYLCMETKEIWEESFGFSYETNDKFLEIFGKKTLKI